MENETNNVVAIDGTSEVQAPARPTYSFEFKDGRGNVSHDGYLFVTPQVAGVAEQDSTINVFYQLDDVKSVSRVTNA